MKKIYLFTAILLMLSVISRAQVPWNYIVDSTSIVGVVDMTNAHVYYSSSSPCASCNSYIGMDYVYNDQDQQSFFSNFSVYDESLEYIFLNSNGLLYFNNYVPGTTIGNDLTTVINNYVLQWGGDIDGTYDTVRAMVWEIPDGPEVFTVEVSFQFDETPSELEYASKVQIHFISYYDVIEVQYFDISGSEGSSGNCGITAGDGVNYTYLNTDGTFPLVDASFILKPGIDDDLELLYLDLGDETIACELNPVNATVGVFNSGSNSQSDFDVNLFVSDTLFATYTVTETLEQYDYIEFTFPESISTFDDGTIPVRAEIDFVDEIDNNAQLDYLFDLLSAEALPASACYGGTTSLEATGGDFYVWASADQPDVILYSGSDPFEVPENIYEPQEYIVNAMSNDVYLLDVVNQFYYIDHDSQSGDDRGGIAVTPDYFYIVGDEYTVRMDANTLGGQTSLPMRDGIFSDLESGLLYSLYNTGLSEDLNYDDSSFPFTVDAIVELDAELEITDNIILLDQPFDIGTDNDEGCIFAGKGVVLVKNGDDNDLYQIEIETGVVDSIGVFDNLNDNWNSENWAMWGFVEQVDGEVVSLVMPSYDDYYGLSRFDLSTGEKYEIVDFEEESTDYYPDDLHSITYSPWTGRIYYHSETDEEDGGYFQAMASLSGDCWASVTVDVVEEAWAGFDNSEYVCNDAIVELFPMVPGNPDEGGDWTDVNSTGYLEGGSLDVTELSEGTYEFIYTVNALAPCVDNAQSTLIIHVNEAANAGNGSDAEVCNTAGFYNLNESLDGTQDVYGYWTDDDATGALNGSLVELDDLSLNTYTFTYHAFGYGACEEDVESVELTVNDCTGIEENHLGLKIYPNPTNGVVYLEMSNNLSEYNVKLTDVQGRVVFNQLQTNHRLDLTSLPKGMYYVEIVTNDTSIVKKIVLE